MPTLSNRNSHNFVWIWLNQRFQPPIMMLYKSNCVGAGRVKLGHSYSRLNSNRGPSYSPRNVFKVAASRPTMDPIWDNYNAAWVGAWRNFVDFLTNTSMKVFVASALFIQDAVPWDKGFYHENEVFQYPGNYIAFFSDVLGQNFWKFIHFGEDRRRQASLRGSRHSSHKSKWQWVEQAYLQSHLRETSLTDNLFNISLKGLLKS